MKGYIIEAYNNMNDSYVSTRLIEEAERCGIDLSIIGVHDTVICNDKVFNLEKQVESCDFIINRYKWGKTKDFLNTLARRTYNKIEAFDIYVNKFEQIRRIYSPYMDKPKYILGYSGFTYDFLSNILGKRFVAKGLENSMGREIFLIESEDDMQEIRNYENQKQWLFEEFIDTSFGKDLRVYSIRGNVVACIIRQSENDFRANVALGARTIECEITEEIRCIAKDIYSQTGLDFVGIDLLFGVNRFIFCEINVMAGFQGIEKATGKNVAREIIISICEDYVVE